ncbi:DUF6165 family protein [Pelagibacteraceae bacterium]|nr:DUF6165 family protein [Pelagibacteraceae bacterium]
MNTKLDKILAEISIGELIDKITILEIKKSKINDNTKILKVNKELISLDSTLDKSITADQLNSISELIDQLKNINLKLWDIEDGKRLAEKNKQFDDKFIELARNVYKFNDERADLKLKINNILGSNIQEIKSYK